jgi:hypothetical protein
MSMFGCSDEKEGTRGKRSSLRKRSKRSLNFVKLLSLCPIFWHEQREQREQRFKINSLQHEQGSHYVRTIRTTFIIKDLRAHARFMNRVNEVDEV